MDSLQSVPAIASGWVIYFHVGALSVLIWDIVNNLRNDYNMLVSDFCIKTFLYLLSRTMTFLYSFTKVVYLTIPMEICDILDDALSAFYIVGMFAILLLASFHLVLLLENRGPVFTALLVLCTLVVGGNITLPIGVAGHNPLSSQSRVCQDTTREYVATAFILLFVYHAIMLCVILFASRQSAPEDRESLTTQDRYNSNKKANRRTSVLFLSQPLSSEHYAFYVSTAGLSLAGAIWFLVSFKASGSFRLVPITVYLVCASTMLGRVLRANKREEKQRRVSEALSAPIKLDMPRLDINDTLTTRTHEHAQGTQCDVAGLFTSDSASCITTPPIVEIEVNKVVQSKHDYSTPDTDYQSDDGRWARDKQDLRK